MGRRQDGLFVATTELPIVQRALRALLISHGWACACVVCKTGRPLLGRIEDKLTTPIPRAAVDQGETH